MTQRKLACIGRCHLHLLSASDRQGPNLRVQRHQQLSPGTAGLHAQREALSREPRVPAAPDGVYKSKAHRCVGADLPCTDRTAVRSNSTSASTDGLHAADLIIGRSACASMGAAGENTHTVHTESAVPPRGDGGARRSGQACLCEAYLRLWGTCLQGRRGDAFLRHPATRWVPNNCDVHPGVRWWRGEDRSGDDLRLANHLRRWRGENGLKGQSVLDHPLSPFSPS